MKLLENDVQGAAENFVKALEITQRLAHADPNSLQRRRDLAVLVQRLRIVTLARSRDRSLSIGDRRTVLVEARQWALRELQEWRELKSSDMLAVSDAHWIDNAQKAIDTIEREISALERK